MNHESFNVVDERDCMVAMIALSEMVGQEEFEIVSERVLAKVRSAASARWVIDLSRCGYLGSAFLGLLVNVRQLLLGAGGSLVLCGLNDDLRDVMRTCSLERLFPIARDRAEAIKRLADPS
jgi:anti-anti-sigma factor